MTPNQITIVRVGAAFAAVALFTISRHAFVIDVIAVLLTILAIALDGVDGYIARTRNLSTPLGAQLDILGDRVVENLFFTFFAVAGLISLWIPVVFFVRGALTDFLRSLASREGRTGFGQTGMLQTGWGCALVASRFSRSAYAVLKCVCFCYLGMLLPLARVTAPWLSATTRLSLSLAEQVLVGATVAFCVVRAVPVIWEGRRYLDVSSDARPTNPPVAGAPTPLRIAAAVSVGPVIR